MLVLASTDRKRMFFNRVVVEFFRLQTSGDGVIFAEQMNITVWCVIEEKLAGSSAARRRITQLAYANRPLIAHWSVTVFGRAT